MNAQPQRHMKQANKQPMKYYYAVIKCGSIASIFETVSPTRAEVDAKSSGTLLVELTTKEYELLKLAECKIGFVDFLLTGIQEKVNKVNIGEAMQ